MPTSAHRIWVYGGGRGVPRRARWPGQVADGAPTRMSHQMRAPAPGRRQRVTALGKSLGSERRLATLRYGGPRRNSKC